MTKDLKNETQDNDQFNEIGNADILIMRYLDKSITDEEMAEFSQWINSDEKNKQHFREIRDLHLGLRSFYREDESNWNTFDHELEKRRFKHVSMQVLKYAAVLIFAVGATIGIMKLLQPETPLKTFVCNSYGLPVTLTLGDGTFVKLGAKSSLSYNSKYNVDNRDIKLQGEAFFVVAKDKEKPFIITSGNNEITVTGTKFEVDSRDENIFTTTLVEGGIRFFNKESGKTMTLTSGRKLEYNNLSSSMSLSISHASVEDFLADEHAFYSEPLSSILERMGNVYGVEFVCKSKALLNKQYRSIFNDGESLESFLEVIQSLTGLKYKVVGSSTIVLYL
jgi:transmembrane sensor